MATNTPLQSILLTSSTSTIVFSNIDQNYTDLVLVVSAKVDTGLDIWLRCNGDSGSNYGYVTFTGNGTTPTSSRTSNVTEGLLADWDGVPKPTFGHVLTFTLNNYSNTTTYKTSLARSNRGDSGVDFVTSTWRNTNAITNLTLRASNGSRTFDAGTTVDLYGIKSGAPKAFGGDAVTTDGNYWYHTFKTSGTFLLQRPTSVDYLVVAGGGGGGGSIGAGGGGGGMRTGSAMSLTASTSYTVTVGAGGAGGSTNNSGNQGSSSVFNTITSAGGGFGARFDLAGGSGGSGGGAGRGTNNSFAAGNTPSTSPSQGANGGSGINFGNGGTGAGGGGGGGGESGVQGGTVVNNSNAGNGGAGTASSITGSSITYAGGGGGGAHSGYISTAGTGGTGGGGAGSVGNPGAAGTAGTANLGGGGGGGAGNEPSTGGNGGSGIVIVRYAV